MCMFYVSFFNAICVKATLFFQEKMVVLSKKTVKRLVKNENLGSVSPAKLTFSYLFFKVLHFKRKIGQRFPCNLPFLNYEKHFHWSLKQNKIFTLYFHSYIITNQLLNCLWVSGCTLIHPNLKKNKKKNFSRNSNLNMLRVRARGFFCKSATELF